MSTLRHATVVARPYADGWRGVMLTGPSGVGKSDLALRLIQAGFRLVADDYAHVWASGGRLYAAAPHSIAGRIEARGLGILPAPTRMMAPIRLIAHLMSEPVERLPEPRFETVDGVDVAAIDLDPRPASAVAVVAGALAGFDRGAVWPI